MNRRRLERFYAQSTTRPSNFEISSPSETVNVSKIQQIQGETTVKNIYEDRQTNREVSTQKKENYIFHVPTDYEIKKILGYGAHGVVAAATTKSTHKEIAIKQIKLEEEPSHDDEEKLHLWKSAYRELSLLRQLSKDGGHPNVIMLKDAFFVSMSNKHELMLLTNLMQTSLDTLMASRSLTNEEKQQYTYQILSGLHYLHSNDIIHRDLKSANVLVNEDNLCIADLGQARVAQASRDDISLSICDDTRRTTPMTFQGVGTFVYRAPELLFSCPHYTYSVDQWSTGCIFGEMFLKPNKTLFTAGEQGDHLFAIIREIFQLIGTPTSPDDIEWMPIEWSKFIRSRCSKEPVQPGWNTLSIADGVALDLLKKLLEFNPSGRITSGQALKHNYFSNTNL
ncbi:unnamed protein product, partial [Adineta steineri]